MEVNDICDEADAIVIGNASIPICDGQKNSYRKLAKIIEKKLSTRKNYSVTRRKTPPNLDPDIKTLDSGPLYSEELVEGTMPDNFCINTVGFCRTD